MKNVHSPRNPARAATKPSFEKKIIASILNRIREGRRTPSPGAGAPVFQPAEGLAPAKIREATLSDWAAVTELKRRWGLIPDSYENWRKLWVLNPALRHVEPNRPFGWVLDAGGTIVGYLGNISSTYYFGSKTLSAVTAHGLVVEPSYRATSLTLSAAFFRQTSVDLLLGTTAIEAVGKLSLAFRSNSLPQPDYDTVLFWVLRPFPFAKAVAGKLKLRSSISLVGSALGAVAVVVDKVVHKRSPRRTKSNLKVTSMEAQQIGNDFEQLWTAKRNEKLALLADRRPATLRWHFEIPGDRATTRVLCCYSDCELMGYLVIRHESDPEDGPRRSIICDMLVKEDRPEILGALFGAAYDDAKQATSHVLEVVGFPPNIRKVFLQWNPYQRKFPSCPFYYKAPDAAFHSELLDQALWYASPYDGDATLMP
jgi:hypothetical protein